jgi:hypothetical protein
MKKCVAYPQKDFLMTPGCISDPIKYIKHNISDRWIGHTTYTNFITNKFRFWAPKATIVYFFELTIKFYIRQSPTLKLVNNSRESEKGAKNSYGSYPTEFVLRSKMKTNPS